MNKINQITKYSISNLPTKALKYILIALNTTKKKEKRRKKIIFICFVFFSESDNRIQILLLLFKSIYKYPLLELT